MAADIPNETMPLLGDALKAPDARAAQLAPREGILARLSRLAGKIAGKGSLALADQAVVSGTRFLTTILIGRLCGAEELGLYSLGFTVVFMACCVQESLITYPFTIYRSRLSRGEQRRYAGSALAQSLSLSVLMAPALLLAALLFVSLLQPKTLAPTLATLAAVVPFALLWEFGRRYAFARLEFHRALVLDVVACSTQLVLLGVLAWQGTLSTVLAFAAQAVAFVLAGTGWLIVERRDMHIEPADIVPTARKHWGLGSWIFADKIAAYLIFAALPWLLTFSAGSSTTATGVFAACTTIVFFSNPFILAVANIIAPKAAEAFGMGGAAAVRSVVLLSAGVLGAAMLCFVLFVALFGDLAVTTLYGAEYQGHQSTITVVALSALAAALGIPAYHGLAVKEHVRLNFMASIAGLSVTVLLACLLVRSWGGLGAGCGLLAGDCTATVLRWIYFLRLSPVAETSESSSVSVAEPVMV